MPLPLSSLSQVCRAVVDHLSGQLEASAHSTRVLLGTPASAAASIEDKDFHRVNLFFYRIEPSGFGLTSAPDEPWHIRLFCLVTPFALAEERIGEGENDLRLLGQVMRVFHEQPVLPVVAVDGEQVRLQVVFHPTGAAETRELWATQGDVVYRPSVAYEMALAPVVPNRRRIGSPLVGSVGIGVVTGGTRQAPPPGTPPDVVIVPARARGAVDTSRDDWSPLIAFVADGTLSEALHFQVPPVVAEVEVLVAGRMHELVTLRWEIWRSDRGWSPGESGGDITVSQEVLSSDDLDGGVVVPLPLRDGPGQAVLFAERTYRRLGDPTPRKLRSNPLLVTLHT